MPTIIQFDISNLYLIFYTLFIETKFKYETAGIDVLLLFFKDLFLPLIVTG